MLGNLRTKLESVGRLEILDDVGTKAMGYFAAVPESALSDTELLRRSTALYQIGEVRIAQGNLEGATKPLEESLTLARTLVQRNPRDGHRLFGLGQSHYWVGYVHWRRRNLDEALQATSMRISTSQSHTGARWTLGRADWRRELRTRNSNIGRCCKKRHDLRGALERFKACLAIERALLAAAPARPGPGAERRGVAQRHRGRVEVPRTPQRGARAVWRGSGHSRARFVALDGCKRPLAAAGSAPATATSATCWAASGDTPGAIARYQNAIGICYELVAQDPANLALATRARAESFQTRRRAALTGATTSCPARNWRLR